MNYYVLGKKDNEILKEYLDKYAQKLLSDLQKLLDFGLIEVSTIDIFSPSFLLFISTPDIASLINISYKQQNSQTEMFPGSLKEFIQKLQEQIDMYGGGNLEQSIISLGALIPGTQIRLTLEDANPFNRVNAHPDHKKSGGMMGWGEASQDQWMAVYKKTFEILERADREMYDEINVMIKKIIPLGTGYGVHNSASHKDCIGHLYMGYTIDAPKPEINNLEAIIHESSHNKLNLIMQFDPLILNLQEEKYYSPYRPDARHIHGIYLGVHAIIPTVYILMRSYKEGLFGEDTNWLEKILVYHLKNKIGLRVLLKYAKLTELGYKILSEMQEVSLLSDQLLKLLPLDSVLIQRAKIAQQNHFSQVNTNYPHLQY